MKDVFGRNQKRQMIGKLTDAMTVSEGESRRDVTCCRQ